MPAATSTATMMSMMTQLIEPPLRPDPRRNPWRDDLACESMRAAVDVPRYVAGFERQVMRAVVAMRRMPDLRTGIETEILFGERVTVFEEADGWSWVQIARDRYVGYVRSDALSQELTLPTHRVKAIGTFAT